MAKLGSIFALAALGLNPLAHANPTGGSIASGSATISGTGTSNVTINQASNTAIINWNSFSIGQGELTTFLQPSASSAALNRVTGGGLTTINGTLNANGQIFIINGNGIYVGKSGSVNTAGFTASTLDITDKNFNSGHLQFQGTSAAAVQNLGAINAMGGSLYLIGQTVDNEGALAASGTVGLASAQNVLITQRGTEHVFVSPSRNVIAKNSGTAVTNNGSISAATAELRAANGNMYALAINNGGTIRASSIAKQGGHIYLTSDTGIVVNTGTLDASAGVAGANGGTVQLKTAGTVVHHGKILAHGGQGGTGGTVDLSGGVLDFTGGVDLTTIAGKTGSLLLDPQSINIINDPNANGTLTTTGAITTYMPAPNFIGSELYTNTLEAQLALANVIVNGISNVTVTDPITWSNTTATSDIGSYGFELGTTLTLQTTSLGRTPGTIVINAPITAHVISADPSKPLISTRPKDGLIIDAAGNGFVTTGLNGAIDIDNFTLKNGTWQQIVSGLAPTALIPGRITALPAFNVSNDFHLNNTSTFERFAGGNGLLPTARAPGNSPYQIVDLYGLQGIGSPSGKLLTGNFVLNNDIGTSDTTINWNGGNGTNGGAGFLPIGEGGAIERIFSGSFNGNDNTIDGLYFYRPNDNLTGIFGEVTGSILNTKVRAVGAEGVGITGILVGRLDAGLIQNCFVADSAISGPATQFAGTTDNQSQLASLGILSFSAGSIAGEVLARGRVVDSQADVGFTLLGGGGPISGLGGVAGLVGINYGTIVNCSSTAGGDTAVSIVASGSSRPSYRTESISIGGLVGTNFGIIDGGTTSGLVSATSGFGLQEASILSGVGNFYIGGFVGVNYGTVDGTIVVGTGRQAVRETYQAFSAATVVGPTGGDVDGGTGSYYVGGFAGANYGSIANAYAAPDIAGVADREGYSPSGGIGVYGNGNLSGPAGASSGALGDYAVGGFAGGNFGVIVHSGSEMAVISADNINGIANTTVKTVTTPTKVVFSNPLALDSVFTGGFVGLAGVGSRISSSFSDPSAVTIAFTLDPNSNTPAAAQAGLTFTLLGPGANNPLVTSTGVITGGNGYEIVGGFAGGNYGAISTSYSSGDVQVNGTTTQSNSFYTGGFIGVNSGGVANVYETGNATSITSNGPNPNNQTGVVGGLIAQMNAGSAIYTYSTGTVSGGTTRGGLIGVRAAGGVSRSFWNTDNNPGLNYSAGGAGVLGETTAQMQLNLSTIPTSIYGRAGWDFRKTWAAPASAGLPTLQGVP